jgi:hypothetical protein
MEGLDDMIKNMTTTVAPSAPKKSPSNLASPKCTNTNEQNYTIETEENIAAVLQSYKSILNDLADSKINDGINNVLSRIRYANFVEYYLENASLSNYSIESELNRMDFEVTYHGTTTTCKTTIQDFFWETKLHDVWRFSNQSVYADVLKNLQCYFEGLDLNISAMASTSIFCLNLDDNLFSARGLFDIVLESHSLKDHRLKIATIAANIEVSIKHKTLRQWLEQPKIEMVFDEDLRNAAITLLASEDSNLDFATAESSSAAPLKIDSLVDAVTDTAQALPDQINSIITDFSLEGAVGFFGKLIGAADDRENSSSLAFGELSNALRENKQLPVDTTLSTENISSETLAADSSCKSTSMDDVKTDDDEDWDDWE